MSARLNRSAYETLVAEDIAWLLKQEVSLERDHLVLMAQTSTRFLYPEHLLDDEALVKDIATQLGILPVYAKVALRAVVEHIAETLRVKPSA